ncbi:putative chromate ion transporter [Lentithecium fluviatile CBS 122367]|uniref:Putative chromate ion transporter n=1 Tax=Lentithecium fluviatile CBS 122367 TaxID=1168545 RepID=A0A6G1JN95_9PLEO|nr:putative chromate ion transporter [Lentithecium fluviatile CBS 122367]
MPLLDIYRAVRDHTRDQRNSLQANNKGLVWRLSECFTRTWDLGFTAFGGPPVHFQILHRRFVEGVGGKNKWIDEQTYQELFAICQALPGPASTKMVFCIAMIHAGVIPAIFVFLLWSLPGAIAMYALSLGVQKMPDQLPPIVYALLSGLNASTVGIIALAAVQLATKAINDRLSRILVIFGACAGLCYSALWYFPVLILIGAFVTVIWDTWLQQQVGKIQAKRARRKREEAGAVEANPIESVSIDEQSRERPAEGIQRRTQATTSIELSASERTDTGAGRSAQGTDDGLQPGTAERTDTNTHGIPVKLGVGIIAGFLVSFTIIMALRGTLKVRTLAFDLFANMYLAGTIIFGGGPVVIPLLREYVVEPGWVSPRDFLLGLAIIQALPGPNFNFGVYLGALALVPTNTHSIFGALLGYLGIFAPGIILSVGIQSLWRVLRTKPWIVSMLRGINATAVGLVFTAVYRLWEIGYLTPESSRGKSLAAEPWWVVVAAVTYAESAWFGVSPAAAIVMGALLGLGWFGAVGR